MRGGRRRPGVPPDDLPPGRRRGDPDRRCRQVCPHPDSPWSADAAGFAGTTDSSWSADAARFAGTAGSADAARFAGTADSPWSADAAQAAWTAGAVSADARLAAHAGPVFRIGPPRLHVVADIDAIPDVDVSVVDIAAPAARADGLAGPPAGIGRTPARIAGPARRVDRARPPVPVIVVPQRPDRDARAEAEERSDAGIWLIDRDRVVCGDIDRRGIGRLDFDVGLLHGSPVRGRDQLLGGRDGLLAGGLENAGLLRLGAKLLDDVGDVLGLVHFGVAQVRRPVGIRAHHLDDVRKAREGLYRRIPILVVDPGIIVVGYERLVLVEPALRLDDLHRVGAGGQELREQGVGIERDRGDQLFELGASESLCGRRLLGGGRVGRRRGRRGWIVLRLDQLRRRAQRRRKRESKQALREPCPAAVRTAHPRVLQFAASDLRPRGLPSVRGLTVAPQASGRRPTRLS